MERSRIAFGRRGSFEQPVSGVGASKGQHTVWLTRKGMSLKSEPEEQRRHRENLSRVVPAGNKSVKPSNQFIFSHREYPVRSPSFVFCFLFFFRQRNGQRSLHYSSPGLGNGEARLDLSRTLFTTTFPAPTTLTAIRLCNPFRLRVRVFDHLISCSSTIKATAKCMEG